MEERKLVPIHDQPVQHPSAWYGRDLVNDPSWLVQLAPQDLTEIATAVRGVKMHGLTLGDLRPAIEPASEAESCRARPDRPRSCPGARPQRC
jgi:hypothetical protein